jgi:hypothetical protein
MLSALGIEMNTLSRDLANTMAGAQADVHRVLQQLTTMFAGAKSGLPPPPEVPGKVSQAIGKLVFISVLNEAIDKASKNPHFNVETAVNDLWVHLESARKVSTSSAAPGAPSPPMSEGEMRKLQDALAKRAEMFRLLTNLSQARHEMSKSIIQNMR